VRQAIRRTVVKPYLNRNGDLPAYVLDPAIEQEIEAAVEHGEHASHLGLSPQRMRAIVDKIRQAVGSLQGPAVLITSSGARYFLRQMLEQAMPRLYVLAHNEIPPETRVVSLKLIQ
jgi:flagellar biosynthesis protein FlhA